MLRPAPSIDRNDNRPVDWTALRDRHANNGLLNFRILVRAEVGLKTWSPDRKAGGLALDSGRSPGPENGIWELGDR